MSNEATARIKINKLLEAAGWRFFASADGPANIRLESSATLTHADIDAFGNDFEKTSTGKIDFLLLNQKGFPLIVLEAKSEKFNPLVGKEQARTYARSQNCRFIILSNGNLHYFWDLERGNPYQLTDFPRPESVAGYAKTVPNPRRLIDEPVGADYIALTQRPNYANEAGYKNEAERSAYIAANKLRFLRDYQLQAIQALQRAVADGRDRFLFVMATGTGKTLISAAIIKLFLRTGNAGRVLFLVDRLELEDQADKNFAKDPALLKNDFTSVIYKDKRDEWHSAHVVVTTVQSLLHNDKYRELFSPTDFDLVISDEAHRSIGGNARAVFNYFVGYKLGLTATPRDYIKNFHPSDKTADGEREKRLYLDTYRTFGCEDGVTTFQFGLEDGAKQGFLIPPTVIDARTEVTTKLLADQGYSVSYVDEQGVAQTESFEQQQFEKKFFSPRTNALFCKTLLEGGLRDPVTGEFGKTIVFAVRQSHAAALTQLLNEMADRMYPGKYQSDFAVQVTSNVADAQQFTKNFANNNLLGSANFDPYYKTSKARICVTVGMMTTGYDCPDILNLALMRPIFSLTDFVQIKGRGTRKHDFREHYGNTPEPLRSEIAEPVKTRYKLFDFFANCDYFQNGYDYDEVLKLPATGSDDSTTPGPLPPVTGGPGTYTYGGDDTLVSIAEQTFPGGMKADLHFFRSFGEKLRADETLAAAVEAGRWSEVLDRVNADFLNKPREYYTLDKLRRAAGIDRRLGLREILEYVFGLVPKLKMKDEILEEEFAKFVVEHTPSEPSAVLSIKNYFKAYATSDHLRHIIDTRDFAQLHTNPGFNFSDFRAVPDSPVNFRTIVPEYIKDYVPLNQFAA